MHAAHELHGLGVLREHLREPRPLAALDLATHGGQQQRARAEVVAEHPVARPDGRREAAQARVPEPVLAEVVDDRVEQSFPGAACHAEYCTEWYMFHLAHSG